MVSDSRRQSWKNKAESQESRAESCLSDGLLSEASDGFRKAARYRKKLASEAESDRLAEANKKKAADLVSKAVDVEGGGEISADDDVRSRSDVDEDSSGVVDVVSSEFFGESPDLVLDDVAGLEDVKHRFHEDVVFPLDNREYYERHGVGIVNGVLMYGPPGTGKTYTARAVAGELGVPFAEVSPAQMSSKMVGEASDLVEELFDESLKLEPCVVFLDEVDSLANSRGSGMQQTRSERQSVTQLLEEMERIQGSEVLVVAATNLKSDVDGAMLRSGRFSTHIEVPEPDAETRRAVFQKHLEDKQTEGDFDFMLLGKASDGFSCSDVAECVGDATRCAARESAERGELRPVRYRHLLQSVKKCEPSLKEWSDS